ncbi:uncharacterized protein FA14DRAFT_162247 [Meira miltonrushii]|uniref:Uncharacterized protein n=1 Tax=Meira miltonrushii TaxID=1280837 RepID=A0A316V3Q4_9BASI|nr:uncharacterized protein FA14DRAFT_162247 [Meira miltonrushii]PWN31884.1 hypothetical protein FA14DRAFT_162247 [Meira miltonrushii]
MASTASSRRPPPLRTVSSTPTRKPPPIPPPTLPLSRSQQLANAIAAAEAQMKDALDQSQKQQQRQQQGTESNNAADVIWQGKGASLFEKGLPSPVGNHTSNEDSQGEFADADEGFDSDEARSVDDNTTFTTLSTSGSTTKRSTSNTMPPLPSPSLRKGSLPAAPARPQRKAPRNPHPIADEIEMEENDEDWGEDDMDAGTTYGHASRASIGSSIWAGRGKKKNFTDDADIPALPSPDLSVIAHKSNPKVRKDRISMAETSSVYSQGGATDWNDDAHHQALEQTPPLDKIRQLGSHMSPQSRDDEFEMMDTQSVYEGRNSISSNSAGLTSPTFAPNTAEPERRLPDGTLVPKMPPLPPHHYSPDPSSQNGVQKRGKKGRRNRSPILSYADGEEEEERLVQERELREHGGIGGLQTTATGMGPKLKKNSPAPWEMDNDLDLDSSASVGGSSTGAKRSTDGPYSGLHSRPSMEHLFASGMKNPSNWARQSMEQFRNRSVSNGGTPSPMPAGHANHPGASNISLPSSKSTTAFPGNPSNPIAQASSPLAGMPKGANWLDDEPSSQMENAPTGDEAPSRRSRTKSISGSAAGMLKGLGLASSAAPAKKASSSRLAKAFQRGNKNGPQGASLPAEGNRKQSLNLSRGISSDDYAHLPPSPTLHQNNINLQVANGSSPYMSHSSANSHSSLSHRSDGSPGLASFVPATAVPPMPKRRTSNGASTHSVNQSGSAVPNSSADGHSLTGSSSSHNLQQKLNGGLHRAEMMDMIMSSNAKARESHPRNPTEGSVAGSSDTAADATSPQRPALNIQKASPNGKKTDSQDSSNTSPKHAMPYKNTFGFGGSAERASTGVPHQQNLKSQQAGQVRTKVVTTGPEGELRSNESIGSQSQDSQRSGERSAKPAEGGATSLPKLPSVGAHDGVPYKLISLEEARLQQQRANQSAETGPGLPTSNSEKNMGLILNQGEPITGSERERSLKNKKSGGFLRRFGKEKSDNNPDNVGPMPSFAPPNPSQNVFQQGESTAVQAPPTLSVRPMSSMFSGFAPGFIDTLAVTEEGDEDAERQNESNDPNGFLSPSNAVQRTLAPHSPAITVASVDSGTSGADYYDAHDVITSNPPVQQNNLKAPSSTVNGAKLRAPTSGANGNPPTFVAHMSSRPSTDSTQSDNSSALGLVSGFPNLPTTGHGATAASLTGKDRVEGTMTATPMSSANADGISSLASATRSRALEIEAKMTELHAELVKLRVFAIDSGLAKPVQQIGSPDLGNNNVLATKEIDPELSEKEIAQQEDALLIPIDPCSHCGCHCAEQKRLQSLNELAILKGISVLDRGRALKPLAGQNGSKFGGYLDR